MHNLKKWLDILSEMTIPADRYDAITLLKRHGYDVLGSPGSYATVLAKYGEPWVLKLFDTSDLAYPVFVRFVLAHPNPHFPKFKRGFITVTPHYRAVRMERLTPFDELQGKQHLTEMIDSYLVVAESDRSPYKSVYYDEHLPLAEELKHNEPSLCKALDLLDQGLISKGFIPDINDGNLALRSDGTVVLLDPIAGGHNLKPDGT